MNDFRYHGALDGLDEAARLTRRSFRCLSVPLAAPGEATWDRLRGVDRLQHQAFVFRQHLTLSRRVRELPESAPILIREFSTLPLAVLAGRFRPRHRPCFAMVHHNLQWALRSPLQRLGLRALDQAGFRFVFFETKPDAINHQLGLRMDRHVTLPHPALPPQANPPKPAPEPPHIGLAGQYRREKGMDDALLKLLDVGPLPFRIRVGIPNPDEFRASRAFVRRAEFDLVDTREDAVFRSFLADCDALLLSYEPSAYEYRPSGLIADAVAAGTPVVAPDFPLQRAQVLEPVPIGEIRAAGEPMLSAITRALDGARSGIYDFKAYAAARAPERLADIMDSWIEPPRDSAGSPGQPALGIPA